MRILAPSTQPTRSPGKAIFEKLRIWMTAPVESRAFRVGSGSP